MGGKFIVGDLGLKRVGIAAKHVEQVAPGIVRRGTGATLLLPGRLQSVTAPGCPTRLQPCGSRMSGHTAWALNTSPGARRQSCAQRRVAAPRPRAPGAH